MSEDTAGEFISLDQHEYSITCTIANIYSHFCDYALNKKTTQATALKEILESEYEAAKTESELISDSKIPGVDLSIKAFFYWLACVYENQYSKGNYLKEQTAEALNNYANTAKQNPRLKSFVLMIQAWQDYQEKDQDHQDHQGKALWLLQEAKKAEVKGSISGGMAHVLLAMLLLNNVSCGLNTDEASLQETVKECKELLNTAVELGFDFDTLLSSNKEVNALSDAIQSGKLGVIADRSIKMFSLNSIAHVNPVEKMSDNVAKHFAEEQKPSVVLFYMLLLAARIFDNKSTQAFFAGFAINQLITADKQNLFDDQHNAGIWNTCLQLLKDENGEPKSWEKLCLAMIDIVIGYEATKNKVTRNKKAREILEKLQEIDKEAALSGNEKINRFVSWGVMFFQDVSFQGATNLQKIGRVVGESGAMSKLGQMGLSVLEMFALISQDSSRKLSTACSNFLNKGDLIIPDPSNTSGYRTKRVNIPAGQSNAFFQKYLFLTLMQSIGNRTDEKSRHNPRELTGLATLAKLASATEFDQKKVNIENAFNQLLARGVDFKAYMMETGMESAVNNFTRTGKLGCVSLISLQKLMQFKGKCETTGEKEESNRAWAQYFYGLCLASRGLYEAATEQMHGACQLADKHKLKDLLEANGGFLNQLLKPRKLQDLKKAISDKLNEYTSESGKSKTAKARTVHCKTVMLNTVKSAKTVSDLKNNILSSAFTLSRIKVSRSQKFGRMTVGVDPKDTLSNGILYVFQALLENGCDITLKDLKIAQAKAKAKEQEKAKKGKISHKSSSTLDACWKYIQSNRDKFIKNELETTQSSCGKLVLKCFEFAAADSYARGDRTTDDSMAINMAKVGLFYSESSLSDSSEGSLHGEDDVEQQEELTTTYQHS